MDGRCTATTAAGERCKGKPREDGYCFAHSPALQGKLEESRRAGGRNRSKVARGMKHASHDLQDVSRILDDTLAGVYSGALKPTQGTAIAALAGAKLKLYETYELAGEVKELRERLDGAAS